MELIIKNARIVLSDEIVGGSVRVKNGTIESVDPGRCSLPAALDLEGDFLLPGLIELHTDNLEKQIEPRPGIFWPEPLAAVMAHDVQMAGAGITTVLDAIALGEYHDGPDRSRILDMSIKALARARKSGVLKADHLMHLRCEYSDPKVLEMFLPHAGDPSLRLVSLMDHTPGQRQFTDTGKYREYFGSQSWDDEEFDRISKRLQAVQADCAEKNRAAILEHCARLGLPVASHDDTTEEHIRQAVREDISISEFPTTLKAAEKAHENGISIVMGAPNVVRGGSHSGNISALELAEQGLLDILSSDYVPSSLLCAAFILNRRLDIPLHLAVATVTSNPAAMIGLPDRGKIEPGLRGDMIRVRMVEKLPVVLKTWCAKKGTAAEAKAA